MPKKQFKRANKRNKRTKHQLMRPRPEQGLYNRDGSYQIIVPRRFRIVPPSMITNLVFQSTAHNPLNNAGLTYASVRFRPTSAYDVDPTLGGTSMPGYNELSGLYGKYRVLRWRTEVVASNLELDNQLFLVVFHSNFDLGNNYSQVQSQFGNSFSYYKAMSPKGGLDRAKIRTPWISARALVGSDSVYLDDDYAANTNASPTNNSYVNIAIWTGNGVNLAQGANIMVVITAEVRFSETLHNVTLPDPPEMHPELCPQQDAVVFANSRSCEDQAIVPNEATLERVSRPTNPLFAATDSGMRCNATLRGNVNTSTRTVSTSSRGVNNYRIANVSPAYPEGPPLGAREVEEGLCALRIDQPGNRTR